MSVHFPVSHPRSDLCKSFHNGSALWPPRSWPGPLDNPDFPASRASSESHFYSLTTQNKTDNAYRQPGSDMIPSFIFFHPVNTSYNQSLYFNQQEQVHRPTAVYTRSFRIFRTPSFILESASNLASCLDLRSCISDCKTVICLADHLQII